MNKKINLAIVGATGAVGETMLSILEQRKFPVAEIFPLASERSAGQRISFQGKSVVIGNLADFDFSQVQVGLFSAGGSVSAEYAPRAAETGCVVVDNTSHFRREDDIPLVVPEVNTHAIADYTNRNIIANPNCSTIQMVVALKPIYDKVGIKRINVCTYQAVSGAGKRGVEELASQSAALLSGKSVENTVHPKQIAFNAIPHIDQFQENGYTREEMKIVWETQKIMEDDSILVNPTAVRIPVFYGHSEAVHLETRRKITASQAMEVLRTAPGVKVLDQREPGGYPTAVTEGANKDAVYVGRIREDISCKNGLNLWLVADNVRKGAALNSVQIAENLIKYHL